MNKELKLRKVYSEALELLNIPEIPLSTEVVDRCIFNMGYFQFIENSKLPKPTIFVGIPSDNVEAYNLPKDIEFKNNFEIAVYVLFHELGHYFHWLKYPKHFNRFKNYYTKGSHNKLEKVANKIAHILFNKYSRNDYES